MFTVTAMLFAVTVFGQTNKQDSLHIIKDDRSINYFELTNNAATIALTPFAQHG